MREKGLAWQAIREQSAQSFLVSNYTHETQGAGEDEGEEQKRVMGRRMRVEVYSGFSGSFSDPNVMRCTE